MQMFDRRDFLKESLLPAAALPLLAAHEGTRVAAQETKKPAADGAVVGLVDTNVHLFDWPFRRLKYRKTADLIAKLKRHRVTEAWAGNFEALLHKNLDAANGRLAEECRVNGTAMLVPVGSINPVWPDWEEDLRRLHEVHKMPGLRLYPSYHNYSLDRPEFVELLGKASERGLIVQIAFDIEDERVHHPVLRLAAVDAAPLIDAAKKVPKARIQLLNCRSALPRTGTATLVQDTKISFDISNIEGVGALGRLIEGNHWSIKAQIPATRLIFGSHAPYAPCEAALMRLFESPLEREQMVAIMQGNAKALLTKA